MPSALEYVPPTDKARDKFAFELQNERINRRTRYLQALKYFNGDQPDQLDFDPEVEPDDNTMINLVQITAERTVSFLFPQVPKFQTDPKAVDETPEEEWIRKTIFENGGLAFLVKIGLRGFLAGHTFVKVLPPKKVGRRMTKPRFVALDPLAVTVFWSEDNVSEVLWYENRYRKGDQIFIQDVVWRPDKGEAGEWEIITYAAATTSTNYMPDAGFSPHGANSNIRTDYLDYVSSENFKIVPTPEGKEYAKHPSPISPIIEFAHLPHPDDYYGHGEVNQEDLQDTINRLWSEINRIVRKHSDPRDVIIGADVSDVEAGDDIMTVPQADAKVQRLEMKGDLTAAVATVDKLVETYLAVARVVLLKGEAKDLQRVTNASVRTLFIDALAKNDILRDSYGVGLVKMIKLAMMMSDEAFASTALDMSVECKWPEALPVDMTEIANINAIMVPLGARSKRTAATAQGDSWAFEQAAIETETQVDMERQSAQMEMMQKFAPPEAATGGAGAPKGASGGTGPKLVPKSGGAAPTGKPGAQVAKAK